MNLSEGIGISGQLGRSANMTNQPMDANGDYDLGLTKFYGKTVQRFDSKEDKWYDTTVPDESIVLEKFLKPLPPIWAEPPLPGRRRVARAVACGSGHMLVVAQDDDGSHAKLYSCGLNNWGQLGHGDRLVEDNEKRVSNNRHALTLVSLPKINSSGPSLVEYLPTPDASVFPFLALR
jgi:Regulator of chromosome condensation (RCC1) repeat